MCVVQFNLHGKSHGIMRIGESARDINEHVYSQRLCTTDKRRRQRSHRHFTSHESLFREREKALDQNQLRRLPPVVGLPDCILLTGDFNDDASTSPLVSWRPVG